MDMSVYGILANRIPYSDIELTTNKSADYDWVQQAI